jgi:hypothetical protein
MRAVADTKNDETAMNRTMRLAYGTGLDTIGTRETTKRNVRIIAICTE